MHAGRNDLRFQKLRLLTNPVCRLSPVFFSAQDSKEGKQALNHLEVSGFTKADNDTYKPILDFKRKYDAVIH